MTIREFYEYFKETGTENYEFTIVTDNGIGDLDFRDFTINDLTKEIRLDYDENSYNED